MLQDGIDMILGKFGDQKFVDEHMPYLLDGDDIVFANLTDAVYKLRGEVDVEEETARIVEHLETVADGFGAAHGYAFVTACRSSIPLPNGYSANRVDPGGGRTQFVKIINIAVDVSYGATMSKLGVSFLVFGALTDVGELDVKDALDAGLQYLNDVLTSYRLIRHDHGIGSITPRQLVGAIDCYSVDGTAGVSVNPTDPIRIHANDVTDIWAKRLLMPHEFRDFVAACESLIQSPEVRYLLNLGVESVDNLCLGEFEDAILNSDRFMELSLRLSYKKHQELPNGRLRDLRSLYSSNPRTRTVLSALLPVLRLNLDEFLPRWSDNARKLRNRLAHELDFSVAKPDAAHAAVRYNMELIQKVTHAFGEEHWDLKLLGNIASLYQRLFESESIETAVRGRQQD